MPLTVPAQIARTPDALVRPCRKGQPLPDADLTAADVAHYWGADRLALAECRARHMALAQHIRGQEKALGMTDGQ